MFRNTFPMRENRIISLSLADQRLGVRPQLWYLLLVHVVYKGIVENVSSHPKLQRF